MVNLSYPRKRKIQIYLVAILLFVCCLVLVACNSDNSYSVEGDTVSEPTHFMARFMMIINDSMGGGATSFGWTVVVFTIILRLILSPLDIWQKLITRKNNKAMVRMKPQLDALQAQYADDKQRLQQEQMALYKKEKYSTMGMCLPTIVTMVVFFVVFAGFRQMVGYQFAKDYKNCVNVFDATIAEQIEEKYEDNGDGIFNLDDVPKTEEGAAFYAEAVDKAQSAVYDAYYSEEQKATRSWLWIHNIFSPDNWDKAVPDFATVTGQAGMATSKLTGITIDEYNEVMGKVLGTGGWNKEKGTWNGFLILPVLSIALSFLSTKLSTITQAGYVKKTRAEKKAEKAEAKAKKAAARAAGEPPQAGQQQSMKMMTYMMPIMFGVFSLFYSGAFALYMFTSSLTAILFQLIFNLIFKIVDKKREGSVNPHVAKR